MNYFGLLKDDVFLWEEMENHELLKNTLDYINLLDNRFADTPQYSHQRYTFKYGNYDSLDIILSSYK